MYTGHDCLRYYDVYIVLGEANKRPTPSPRNDYNFTGAFRDSGTCIFIIIVTSRLAKPCCPRLLVPILQRSCAFP